MTENRIRPALLLLAAATIALAVAWSLRPDSADADAARDCTVEGKCADISISGHAEPQPIHRGERTTLKLTAKNNGVAQSYGDWVQATVPSGLVVKRKTIEGDGNDYGCTDNGFGFV